MTTAPDLTAAAVKMIMALGVVLLLVWGIYRLAKGRLAATPGGRHRKMMHLIESQYVGVKKSIAMVQIPGSVLVLGVGTDVVNLLTRIDDPEVIRDITAASEDRRTSTFREHLQRLTTPSQRKITKTEEDGSVTAP